ncbi:uncharacterized protein LOC117609612 [Osmia lignaria lignaria]|uniref:uncharacterized protein LOC117609612 n=1 Tax=Osmia lignaria lignaria TaxID=1437193 RepID=UPI001478FC3A|nr:uncharacterized protein LOC117609612 [Osmia lignaria]
MNKALFDNYTTTTKMNDDKIKEEYASHNRELDQKYFVAWSPLEENKRLFKQKYISCSRSVPRRNKRFIQYRISRSLNFDANIHSSNSENSSFEEDKHLSRSAKIMRALNFNSSSSYYGRTKIKKSLNFNLTPSPKRFMPTKKSIRKTLSLNFNSPLSVSNKCLNFDDNPNNSADNSLLYSSSESIDENQNETPLQQNPKECGILHYSTPNTKLNKRSLCSTGPSLRSQLRETIDNIVCITVTPNSQSLKRTKGRLDEVTSTSRNLFHEFYDNNDDRPSTPENVIDIIPESTSAIKRSHKKERSSRRKDSRYTEHTDSLEDSADLYSSTDLKNSPLCNSGNVSDTGSLFDYAEEEENSFKESGEASNCDNILFEEHKFDINEIKSEESAENSLEIESINENKSFEKCEDVDKYDLPDQDIDIKFDIRSATPEATAEVISESQTSVTPENRINFLQNVLKDSIKKSHKKIKDDNKKKLFSPKFLRSKFETVNSKQDESEETSVEHREERACTPERVNSSRLLLSQFSSVKKSHKKDKHNKILSGFLKRQEYFNKEMDLCQREADNSFECKNSTADVSSDFDNTENVKDAASFTSVHDTPLIKLSPRKSRRSLNVSLDCEPNVSYDSDLQEADSSKEEFKIFTPLKRKRSTDGSGVKEYLHFYDLPSGKNEVSEDLAVDIGLSRCLTPIPNFRDNYIKTDEDDMEAKKCDSTDVNGRSTPRDMPTTELYVNIDSIKRSHKKNKRANSSWKGFGLFNNDSYMEEQALVKSIKVEALESSNDCITVDDVNESIDHDGQLEVSTDRICNEERASVSTKLVPSNVTPPNCLKSKNYLRLIQETSIKRSHKKVRDKKKQELIVDANELSDDGSIFGDEEKLACDEDQSIKD